MWNIRLQNFICMPSCLDIIYIELSSPKFYVYLRIWILYIFHNDQRANSQFCIHVSIKTFSQQFYITFIYFVHKCSTLLPFFPLLHFHNFFHDSTFAQFVNHPASIENRNNFAARVPQKFTNKYSAARVPQKFYWHQKISKIICNTHPTSIKNGNNFEAWVPQKFINKYSVARMPQKFHWYHKISKIICDIHAAEFPPILFNFQPFMRLDWCRFFV
jgi:hypothetical protein